MAASASTGRERRDLLKAAAVLPVLLLTRRAGATDYASAGEALAAIDALASEVDVRLQRFESLGATARAFAASLRNDLAHHHAERAEVARRLRAVLKVSGPSGGAAALDADLEGLRAAVEKLAYAHAEALPALGDSAAVTVLARHLVDTSRHLTLVSLWIEAEALRG
jgi:hypothetical protein